jgi:hypothetical protein
MPHIPLGLTNSTSSSTVGSAGPGSPALLLSAHMSTLSYASLLRTDDYLTFCAATAQRRPSFFSGAAVPRDGTSASAPGAAVVATASAAVKTGVLAPPLPVPGQQITRSLSDGAASAPPSSSLVVPSNASIMANAGTLMSGAASTAALLASVAAAGLGLEPASLLRASPAALGLRREVIEHVAVALLRRVRQPLSFRSCFDLHDCRFV